MLPVLVKSSLTSGPLQLASTTEGTIHTGITSVAGFPEEEKTWLIFAYCLMPGGIMGKGIFPPRKLNGFSVEWGCCLEYKVS